MKINLVPNIFAFYILSLMIAVNLGLARPAWSESLTQQEIACKAEISALEKKYAGRLDEGRWELDMSYFRLGNIQSDQGRFADAKQAYLKSDDAASGGNGNSMNAKAIAECSFKLHQYGDAEKYYEKALSEAKVVADLNHQEMSPPMASILLGLANVYEDTARGELAEHTYRDVATRVNKIESDKVQRISSPEAFDQLAMFLNRHGQQKEAEQWWQKVAGMRASAHAYASQADALDHYAGMLIKEKRLSEASLLQKRAKQLRQTQARLNARDQEY